MNTFKKGDLIKSRIGQITTVKYTDGSYVFHEFGYSRWNDCTLILKSKFGPGDVVRNNYAEHTIKCVKTHYGIDAEDKYEGPIAYDYVDNGWDEENDITLVRSADEGILDFIDAGKRIEAIRLHRLRYGTGLKEAKDAVEAIEAGLKRNNHRFGFVAAVEAPKFKVGDRVTTSGVKDAGPGTIMGKCQWSTAYWSVKFDSWYGVCAEEESVLTLVGLSQPTIVIRRDPGKGYRPNDNPRIHDSVALATKEAERLAIANPGVEFATFTLAGTSTATAPSVNTVVA